MFQRIVSGDSKWISGFTGLDILGGGFRWRHPKVVTIVWTRMELWITFRLGNAGHDDNPLAGQIEEAAWWGMIVLLCTWLVLLGTQMQVGSDHGNHMEERMVWQVIKASMGWVDMRWLWRHRSNWDKMTQTRFLLIHYCSFTGILWWALVGSVVFSLDGG